MNEGYPTILIDILKYRYKKYKIIWAFREVPFNKIYLKQTSYAFVPTSNGTGALKT